MIITGSNVGMTGSSQITQTYSQETKIINPNSVITSSTSIVGMQFQNSSHIRRDGKVPSDSSYGYKNPAYSKKASQDTDAADARRGAGKAGVTAKISDEAKRMAKNAPAAGVKSTGFKIDSNTAYLMDFRYRLLDSIVRFLSGGKSDLLSVNPFLESHHNNLRGIKDELERMRNPSPKPATEAATTATSLLPGQTVSMNLQKIETTTEFYEEQKMRFQATGTVRTADGREISLEVNLAMSSEFYSSNQTSITQVMQDPLVINFGPGPVSLTQTKFDFDIDCDGKADQISFATGSSGFLAIDNGDGVISDGSQLFGALTGDGFGELAKHDADFNGWIDEADDIFDKLRIWTKDESGNDRLLSLGEAGIGAIYLGNVNTDYNLRGDDGRLDGQIRQTGIFLYESGEAGTVHHVDIAV